MTDRIIRRSDNDYKAQQKAARKRRLKLSTERTKTELCVESEVTE